MPFTTSQTSSGYRSDLVRLPLSANTESTFTQIQIGCVIKYDSAGRALWNTRISTVGFAQVIVYGVNTDAAGNVYATGSVTGASTQNTSLELFNSDGTYATSVVNLGLGGTDAFIVKYNSGGNVQWGTIIRATTNLNEIGFGIAVDSSGNVHVVGQTGVGSVVTAYNADGTAFGTTLGNSGNTDAFVAKYNTNGFVQWVARVGSTAAEFGYAVAIDSSGSVYITGNGGSGVVTTAFSSNGVAFGRTLPSRGSGDAFVVKYNSSGIVQWVAQIATSLGLDTGFTITVDPFGDIYVAGGGSGGVITAYSSNGVAFGTTLANTGGTDAFLVKYNTSGTVQWVARVASTNNESVRGVITDADGNVIIAAPSGSGQTTTAYNSNGTAFATTLPSAGSADTFIVKYNSSGTVQWVTRIASSGSEALYGITTDSSNNVYVTGTYAGALFTAYNSNGTAFGTRLPVMQGTTAFVAKYNSSGNVQWITRIGGTITTWGIDSDSNSNIYIVGGGLGSDLSIFGKSLSTFSTLTNDSGSQDAFVAKYNTNGRPQWVSRISSNGIDIAYSTVTDSLGNIYVTGSYVGSTLTIYNADGSTFATTLPNAGVSTADAFLVKYNSSGVVQWVTRVSSTAADIAYGIAIDPSGTIYITGQGGSAQTITAYNSNGTAFGTTLPNRGAGGSAFLVEYDSSGNVQWVAQIATSTSSARGLGVVASGTGVYVTGFYGNATMTAYNFDGTAFGTTLASTGTQEAFVVKYNTSGTVQWVARLTTTGTDSGNSIAIDTSENVYVTGTYSGTATAWSSNGVAFGTTLANAGTIDGFLVKYNSNGIVQWVSRLSGSSNDIATAVATDLLGNVYIGGSTQAAATITNSNGTITVGNGVATFGILIKYNSAGIAQWIVSISVPTASVNAIAVDRRGNVYVGGNVVSKYTPGGRVLWYQPGDTSTNGLAIDYDNNVIAIGQTSTTSTRFYDRNLTVYARVTPTVQSTFYLVKYAQNMIPQWVASITSPGIMSTSYGLVTDSSGNIYTWIPSDGNTTTVFNTKNQVFGTITGTGILAKYNSSGDAQWVANTVSASSAGGRQSLAVDPSGNCYVASFYTSTFTPRNANGTLFSSALTYGGVSNPDIAIIKYDTNGNVQWTTRISTANVGEDIGAVVTDSSGNFYITGQLGAATGTAFNSNGTAFGTTQASAGLGDAFIAKYDSAGFVQWWARIASTSTESGISVAVDTTGNVFVTGRTGSGNTTVFNANGTSGALLNPGLDVFLVKYDSNGTVQWAINAVSSTQTDSVSNVITDSDGNVYISGSAGGAGTLLTFFGISGSGSTQSLSTSGGSAVGYLLKYNTSGTLLWAVSGFQAGGLSRAQFVSPDTIHCVGSTGSIYDSSKILYGTTGLPQIVSYSTTDGSFRSATAISITRNFSYLASDSFGNLYGQIVGGTVSLSPIPLSV